MTVFFPFLSFSPWLVQYQSVQCVLHVWISRVSRSLSSHGAIHESDWFSSFVNTMIVHNAQGLITGFVAREIKFIYKGLARECVYARGKGDWTC